MTFSRGKARVSRTSLDCRSEGFWAVEREEVETWASAKGSRVKDLF